MPAFAATAPGKTILFGEHAVVFGRPAIAAPVNQVQARASVTANPAGPQGQVWVQAPDIDLNLPLSDLPADHPFALVTQAVLQKTGAARFPALRLQIKSTIPIAAGLGSGAAISVAIARALSAFLGRRLDDEQISDIAYQADQKYHGTPSGIDNTVITYGQPVYFVRGQPFECLPVARPFTLVIGNTGIASPTAAAVSGVKQRWQVNQPEYERWFDQVGTIARQARQAIESGQIDQIGPLMTQNHAILQALGVSSPELDRLVNTAIQAGASGAKLCGAGLGGNMIAVVNPTCAADVSNALAAAGAVSTIITEIRKR